MSLSRCECILAKPLPSSAQPMEAPVEWTARHDKCCALPGSRLRSPWTSASATERRNSWPNSSVSSPSPPPSFFFFFDLALVGVRQATTRARCLQAASSPAKKMQTSVMRWLGGIIHVPSPTSHGFVQRCPPRKGGSASGTKRSTLQRPCWPPATQKPSAAASGNPTAPHQTRTWRPGPSFSHTNDNCPVHSRSFLSNLYDAHTGHLDGGHAR